MEYLYNYSLLLLHILSLSTNETSGNILNASNVGPIWNDASVDAKDGSVNLRSDSRWRGQMASTRRSYSFAVTEDTVPGTLVGSIEVSQWQTCVVEEDNGDNLFLLSPGTGEFLLSRILDFESQQLYVLTVAVQQGGVRVSSVRVYFNVLDVNDNPPAFSTGTLSVSLSEDVPAGTCFLWLKVTDEDEGENGSFTLSLVDKDETFVVSPTGSLCVNSNLDRERQCFYSLTVLAKDGGQPCLSSTGHISVTIEDVNDNAPIFVSPQSVSVPEDTSVHEEVMTVYAVDADSGPNGKVMYFLNLTSDGYFSIDNKSGRVFLELPLDREQADQLNVTVTAMDQGSPPMSSVTLLTIIVEDINDNSPEFLLDFHSVSVREDTPRGTSLCQVQAYDRDSGKNGQIRYSLSERSPFEVDSVRGIISVMSSLDREKELSYAVIISAADRGMVTRSASATLTIQVLDVNDCRPIFHPETFIIHVMEDEEDPTQLTHQISAVDDDSDVNSQLTYTLEDTNGDDFELTSNGSLHISPRLDRERQSSYTLSIIAVDSGSPPLTGTMTVHIMVDDVNDNSPEFSEEVFNTIVSEDSPPGTAFAMITASDMDEGTNGDVRYYIQDHDFPFAIDETSGELFTTDSLDRETTAIYRLTVIASDKHPERPLSSAALVIVLIGDVNDNWPQFVNCPDVVYLSSEMAPGMVACAVRATDRDAEINADLHYSLYGHSSDLFTIDPNSGTVYTSSSLAGHDGMSLNVHVEDAGENPKFDVTTIRIQLRNESHFPFVDVDVLMRSPFENEPVGTVVAVVSAESFRAEPVSFHVANGNHEDQFYVDPLDGTLTMANPLDFEAKKEITLLIEARDSGLPPFSSYAEIHINISDVNDNVPHFTQAEYRCEVLENLPPSWVCDVLAIDADSISYAAVLYNITGGNTDNSFILDPENGMLSTSRGLNREYIAVYSLTVEAVELDNPAHKDNASIVVVVLDVNDNAPHFAQVRLTAAVPEDCPVGHSVLQITSTDEDMGANAAIFYSISDLDSDVPFDINSTSGYVMVKRPLDREMQALYIARVIANDSQWSVSAVVTITVTDVNDNPPIFAAPFYTVTVAEVREVDVAVLRVEANDADRGQNGKIVYFIAPQNEGFWVNNTSGQIHAKQHLTLDGLAFKIYQFIVVAFDCGSNSLFSNSTVQIRVEPFNRYPPMFLPFATPIAIPNDVSLNTSVAEIRAIDLDLGNSSAAVDYFAIGGNASDLFWIQGDSGKVMLRQNLAGSVYSYLTLIVLAKDRGCPSLEAQTQMTIEVTGRNLITPHFNPPVATFLIPEDLPVGSVIRRIQAEDGDEGLNGVVLYRVTSGHQLLPFTVGETTGLITLTGEVDFEEQWDYSFQIHATDRGWESKTGVLNITIQVVDVNDNPPVFLASEYVTSVLENSPVGTRIMDLRAYDADSGANAEIIYSLVAGHVDRFEINSNNGTLTALQVFDYEKEQVFDVTVKAINNNNPALLSLVHVIIQISDVNEFEPTFTQEVYDFSVLKNAPLGSRIGKVTATDSDRGVRGQVFYLVIGRNGGFKVDKHSGEIYTAISLRSHGNSQVILKVLAKNSGVVTGDDVDEAVVRIQVMDINDPPVFSADVYMADIAEDSRTGASVITVKAEDHDSIFDWNYFRFKIEHGNTNLSFSVDPLSGVISVMSPLDRERWPLYNLTVTATDNGFPTATSSANVIIHVTDVNDNAPKLTFSEAQVRENEPRGAFVAKMNVTDSDSPPNQGPFTFWLLNTSSSRLFSLTPDGVLFTTQTFDREQRAAYQVLVAVRDAGLPSMSSTTMFHIQVEDDNDNPPSPRNIFIEVKYFGSSFDGGMIGQVHPEDQDEHDIFVCSVKNGPASMFTIPNGTCQLWSSPFQGEATFNVTIEATDQLHFPVNNSVYVNYKGFTNATMDSCVLFYLSSISLQQFMSFNYLRFVKALDSLFNLQASKTHVFGIKQIGDEILLLAAVKNYNGQYLSRESASDISAGHRRLLESQSNVTISHILSDPCLRSLCQNGGMCTKNIHISQEVAVLESTAVIFVSPRKEIFNCTCPPGFAGQLCEDDVDECQVNPCKNEGTCVNTVGGFHCYCRDGFSGTACLFHEDDCLKCQNGGSCTLSHDGYHCVCVPGFEGKTCDHEVDYCDSHPCVQGSCVNSQTGFSCHCLYGVTGVHCENPCYGFHELSFMEFPPLHHTRNLISLEFATVQNKSLLLFNSGGSSSRDYLALEILNGSVSLTFDLGSEPMRLQMTKEVADGKFHSVVVRRNGNMASLHVDNCTEEGDGFCFLQREGSSSEKTLDVNGNNMTVGGLRSVASLSLSSAPVQTHDFVGCIRNIYVNGIAMRLSTALAANNVFNSCPQKTESPCHSDPCQNGGECRDVWSDYLCVCGDNFTGRNCDTEIPSQLVVRFHGDGFIEFAIKEKFRRTYLVNHHMDEDVDTVAEVELKTKDEGILMSMNSLAENIVIQIKNRRLVLTFHDLESGVLSDFTVAPAVADGRWHRLSLFISEDKTSVSLDGKVAQSISNRSLSLTAFTVQKVVLGSSGEANLQQPGFSGCVRHLAVFGNTLLLSGRDDTVELRPTATLIQSTCTASDFCFPTDCWGGNTSQTFCPHESCPHWTCGNNRSCICLSNFLRYECNICVTNASCSTEEDSFLWIIFFPVFFILIFLVLIFHRRRQRNLISHILCLREKTEPDNVLFCFNETCNIANKCEPGEKCFHTQPVELEYHEISSVCSSSPSEPARPPAKQCDDLRLLLAGFKNQHFNTNLVRLPANDTTQSQKLCYSYRPTELIIHQPSNCLTHDEISQLSSALEPRVTSHQMSVAPGILPSTHPSFDVVQWQDILSMDLNFGSYASVFEDMASLPLEPSFYDVQCDFEEII